MFVLFPSAYLESYTKMHKQIFESSQWKHIKWFYTENFNELEFIPIFSCPKVQLFWTNSNNRKLWNESSQKWNLGFLLSVLYSIWTPLGLKKIFPLHCVMAPCFISDAGQRGHALSVHGHDPYTSKIGPMISRPSLWGCHKHSFFPSRSIIF